MGNSNNKPAYPSDFSYVDDNHFTNGDDKKIFCRYWVPDTPPKAMVFICHGVCEHSGFYDDMAKHLNEEQILAFAHDHVGHGLSEGDRVHIDDMEEYVRDVKQHTDMMKQKHPDIPVFLIGHSMGGTIGLCFALEHHEIFDGLILIGPAVEPNPETVTSCKKSLARTVSHISPQHHVGKIETQWICRDPKVRKSYDEDPLVYHHGVKAKWSVVMLSSMDRIQNNMGHLGVPILCIQGGEDKLCLVDGARSLQKNAKCPDKTLEIFEGGYHQVHKEPDGMKERCWKDISEWIHERLKQGEEEAPTIMEQIKQEVEEVKEEIEQTAAEVKEDIEEKVAEVKEEHQEEHQEEENE